MSIALLRVHAGQEYRRLPVMVVAGGFCQIQRFMLISNILITMSSQQHVHKTSLPCATNSVVMNVIS